MRLPRMRLTCYANQEEHFVQCTVTGDETIVNYMIPKTKRFSMMWEHIKVVIYKIMSLVRKIMGTLSRA